MMGEKGGSLGRGGGKSLAKEKKRSCPPWRRTWVTSRWRAWREKRRVGICGAIKEKEVGWKDNSGLPTVRGGA